MGTIGDTLREARMRQQIDISEVEEHTKIRAKYLRALENEEFGLLPGTTFVRSFLRTYAEYLGLDPHLLVEEFRAQHELPQQGPEIQFAPGSPRRPRREPRPERRSPRPGAVVAAIVVVVIGFLLVLGLTGGEDGDDDGSSRRAGTTEEADRSEAEEREARERRRAEERRRREREAARRRVKLRVDPLGQPTYVCVDDGAGEVLFEGAITEPETFRGRRLRLNLGRRAAKVRLNDDRVAIEPGATPIALDFEAGEEAREIVDEPSPCA